MERYQGTRNRLNHQARFTNPNNDEICRIIQEQGKNPYIELQERILDGVSGRELGTSTIVPYLMMKHNLSDGLIQFVNGFQNHTNEANTELVVQKQVRK